MHELLSALQEILANNIPAAYCRLVETRGSTPQKAGAAMLVHANGQQWGTIGGGCIEAEVKRRAIALLQSGQSEICPFQLDGDYGWDDGLICGGRMKIWIQPICQSEQSKTYFRSLIGEIAAGHGLTEIVQHEVESNLPTSPGPGSALLDASAQILATLGSANLPAWQHAALKNYRPLANRPRPYCDPTFAFLPTLPRYRLIIIGAGHVGKAVADLAAELDFEVWIVDDREDVVSSERFPKATRRLCGPLQDELPKLDITPDTYCLIVTRGHNHDEEALFHLAERGARYLGLIGSRRKIKLIFDDLVSRGISAESLEDVFAPLGIDIGSQTVMEIAVSICAELIAHRNLSGQVPGRRARIPVR